MKQAHDKKIIIQVIICLCAFLFYGTADAQSQALETNLPTSPSKQTKSLDKCLEKHVKELENKTESKVIWSWTRDDAKQVLKDRREEFNIPDGTFCYGVTMRGNQQHLLCGENDPYKETKFLYNLHGLDPTIVERECASKKRGSKVSR